MDRTSVDIGGSQSPIDMQADQEIRRAIWRWMEGKFSPPGIWELIRSGIESMQAIQPQVTIYPYGDMENRGKIREA